MKLSRFGFNLVVLIYLAPLVAMDFIGNTLNTGLVSEMYYYKTMVDGCLVAYALWEMFTDQGTTSVAAARARAQSPNDTVVSFEKLSSWEYIYAAFLCVYAAANWYELHMINKESTGLVSIATLAWSFFSLAVAILAAVQFWRIKSGAIVELSHKVTG